MLIISHTDWPGTKQALLDRVTAFRSAKEAHKQTVGVPAPIEILLVEQLSATSEDFDIEQPVPPAPPPVPPPPVDLSNVDNLDSKVFKAILLCVAQVGGLTVPQIKTMFKNKYDSLP